MNTLMVNTKGYNVPSGNELQEFVETAKMLSSCPYYQKMGPGGILAIFLTAKEMGLPAMCCLNGGMYTFSGAVTLSAQMMNMMINNAGHCIKILECSETACEIEFVRKDRPTGESFKYRYTIEMARAAGYLSKNNWKTHPRDMLFNRCLSGGARKYMPDAIMNAYVHGELGKEDENIMPDGSIVTIPKERTLEIEAVPQENLEAFKAKYGIGNSSEHEVYIKAVAAKCNQTPEQILSAACANEEGFLTNFDKWKKSTPLLQEPKE